MNFFDWLNKAFENDKPKDAMVVAVKERFNPTSTLCNHNPNTCGTFQDARGNACTLRKNAAR